ncbi:MAG: outer membrane beta-barrel protein [Deltaproteobacteria bacterium]|nr:outer membrane beta-barrel protein [Deltaproteobacteria bacterium]
MKKTFIAVLAVAMLAGTTSFADESYVSGGFEASGHIVAGAGWQRLKSAAGTTGLTRDITNTVPGVIGEYSTEAFSAADNKKDEFKFFLDEFELDLAKSFGENIRIRADLDFGSGTMNSGPRFANATGVGGFGSNVVIEQAYATANLAVGNGVEFLLGRFNAPIGFEKVDVFYNDTISRSAIYRSLRPNTFTGAKVYYAFSDLVDWHVYVVNNGSMNYDNGGLNPAGGQNTDVPAFGTRLGFNWGEEGKKSTFGLSGIVGQDHPNQKKHITFIGDADWQWWVSDNFAFGGEGIYRQIDTTTVGGKNGKYFGALANLHYEFSDVWDGTLRYAYTKDNNGLINAGVGVIPITGAAAQSLTGEKEQIHEIALDGSYDVADGASFRLEGTYSLVIPNGTQPAGQASANTAKTNIFGFGAVFAYEF